MTHAHAGVSCQNSPVVGMVNFTGSSAHQQKDLTGTSSVAWARLLPFDMNADDQEAVLHRSHHAMVYIGTFPSAAGQAQLHAFFLWAGFAADMTVLDDLWLVFVHPAGHCAPLSRHHWWQAAWCWTAKRVAQLGRPPSGRAYAHMVVREVWHRCWNALIQSSDLPSIVCMDR